MVDKTDILLEKLQNVFERAIDAPKPKSFFLLLYEYLDVYNNEPALRPVWEGIIKTARKENAPIDKLADKSLAECAKVCKQIKTYVKKNKVTNPTVLKQLDDYEAYDKGQLQSSEGPVKARYGYLAYALMTLTEDSEVDHLGFTRKFGTITDERRIKEWHFSPSYDKFLEKIRIQSRIKLTKVWYSWNKIANFYNVFRDYEKRREASLKNNDVWETLGLDTFFGEIEHILNDTKNPSRHIVEYDADEYKNHLHRVHIYTKEKIVAPSQKIKPYKDNLYRLKGNKLIINDVEIKFQEGPGRLRFLEIIAKKPSGIYYSEIKEELEGEGEGSRDIKNTCYEYCRGIETRLIKKGFADFLIYDYNKASINPIYKKTSK